MTDTYFGYTPIPLPYEAAVYDDYAAGDPAPDYQPTQWDDYHRTNIDSLWEMIKEESNERVTAVADMWRRVATLLDVTGVQLRGYAMTLATKWDSAAAKVFMAQVGRVLYSLDEWQAVARTNAAGLDVIAFTILKNQAPAKAIYLEYVQATEHPGSVSGSALKVIGGSRAGAIFEKESDRKERLRKYYTPKILPHVKDIADTYLDVFFHQLQRGSKFKGPTDAVYTDPKKFIPKPGTLTPGGTLPSAAMISAALAAHRLPKAPPLPAGDQLTLAGQQVTPTLPRPTLPGANLPTPQVPELPTPTGLPGVVPPPGLAGEVRLPGRPGIPGRGGGLPPEEAGFGRPGLPGRPNLSGLRRPGSTPSRPPAPGRGRPNLRGAKERPGTPPEGSGLAEEMEHPNAHGSLPPRLNGRRPGPGTDRPTRTGPGEEPPPRGGVPRGRGSGEPERLRGRRRSGLPEDDEAFRRDAPARPDLAGRNNTARLGGEPEEPGQGRILRGRGTGPEEIGGQRGRDSGPEARGRGRALRGRAGEPEHDRGSAPDRRRSQERRSVEPTGIVPVEGPVGGADELWMVEQAAAPVIDTPEPTRPVDPGPALGRAAG